MVSVSVPHACSVRRNCPHGFVHNLWLLVELLGGAKGHCTACSRFQAAQRELAGSASRQAARSARQHAPASEQLPRVDRPRALSDLVRRGDLREASIQAAGRSRFCPAGSGDARRTYVFLLRAVHFSQSVISRSRPAVHFVINAVVM